MEVDFDPDTHTYRVDGVVVPHVTGVLESERLTDYSHVDPLVLQVAQIRGDFVHKLTALDDKGILDVATIDPSLAPFLDAWRKFRRETWFLPGMVEERLFHPVYRYAGTLDRVGLLDGERVLLDIKTGPILDGAALQTAAYAACLPVPMDKRMGVRLKDNGTYSVETFEDEHDEEIFLAALALYKWRRRK